MEKDLAFHRKKLQIIVIVCICRQLFFFKALWHILDDFLILCFKAKNSVLVSGVKVNGLNISLLVSKYKEILLNNTKHKIFKIIFYIKFDP